MISYAQALQLVREEGTKRHGLCRTECLPLLDCVGRNVAHDICALDNNPRFDNSAMDGFAVTSLETSTATSNSPVRLEVAGCLSAGDAPFHAVTKRNSCIEIMTGAKFPGSPYDAVVRVEDVEQQLDNSGKVAAILLRSPVRAGENIRHLAEDIKIGDKLFPRGTKIAPEHLLALSMAGYAKLEVFAPIRVSVISTGNEIVPFDSEKIESAQIRNSTAPLLCSALKQYGANVSFHGIVADDASQLRGKILEILETRPDVVISTGGVSVGKFDLVESVLQECGAVTHFHKVAVRPGKPILFAEFSPTGPVFFGLPGNPVAVAAGVRFFIRPYLGAIHAEAAERPQQLPLVERVSKPAGLSFFQRGVRDGSGVRVLSGQSSFMVASLIRAEGWIVGSAQPAEIGQGDLVEWYPLW